MPSPAFATCIQPRERLLIKHICYVVMPRGVAVSSRRMQIGTESESSAAKDLLHPMLGGNVKLADQYSRTNESSFQRHPFGKCPIIRGTDHHVPPSDVAQRVGWMKLRQDLAQIKDAGRLRTAQCKISAAWESRWREERLAASSLEKRTCSYALVKERGSFREYQCWSRPRYHHSVSPARQSPAKHDPRAIVQTRQHRLLVSTSKDNGLSYVARLCAELKTRLRKALHSQSLLASFRFLSTTCANRYPIYSTDQWLPSNSNLIVQKAQYLRANASEHGAYGSSAQAALLNLCR